MSQRQLGGIMAAQAAAQDRIKYLFIWPAFLVVLVISLFPLIYALTVSFQTVRVVPPTPPRFVGLANYAEIATSARFWTSIWTTGLITFVSVAFQYALGFALALALHHNVGARRCTVSRSCCRCSLRRWVSR